MSDVKKSSKDECIQVVVRCRPMNKKETEEKRGNIIDIDIGLRQVNISNPEVPDEPAKPFTFDATYDDKTQQRVFYEESCFNMVENCLEGFNATIFAYGQTGCGKSWTMQGPNTTDVELKGVIPNSFTHIFQSVAANKEVAFLVRCAYIELYNEEIKDLLAKDQKNAKCDLKEDPVKGVFIKNLTDVVCECEEDLHKMFDKGLSNRTVAATLMNENSSRSHSIFTVIVEMTSKEESSGKEMVRSGKLNLVDLAGSERQKKTGASGATQKEGIKINMSLSALGNVISALADGSKHIPYRDSKLTRLLQDSLGGSAKTMMIAAISPADYNWSETMSTLRYANRAKNIKNKPKINEDPKDAIIREFKEEIERLKQMLMAQAGGGGGGMDMSIFQQQQQQEEVRRQQHQKQRAAASSSSSSDEAYEEDLAEADDADAAATTTAPLGRSPRGAAPPQQQVAAGSSGRNSARGPSPTMGGGGGGSGGGGGGSNDSYAQESKMQPKQQDDDWDTAGYDDGSGGGGGMSARLREKDYEIQKERQMKEELINRMQQLEQMMALKASASPKKEAREKASADNSPREGAASGSGSGGETAEEAAARIQREEEAQRQYKERKIKAKRKKEKEMERILAEKRAMEGELFDLRASADAAAAAAASGAPATTVVRGPEEEAKKNDSALVKMKKKYEKKLLAAKEEYEDMREDFYFQKKQLMDALVEEEKDTRLFEQICKALLSEKDFKRIVDKSRYDEDHDEWIIPYIKKKDMDSLEAHGGGGAGSVGGKASGGGGGGGGGSSLLPNINMSRQLNNQSLGFGAGGGGGGGSGINSGGGKSGHRNGETTSLSGGLVPLLPMGGAMSSTSPRVDNGGGDDYGGSGGEKKKKKKKNKTGGGNLGELQGPNAFAKFNDTADALFGGDSARGSAQNSARGGGGNPLMPINGSKPSSSSVSKQHSKATTPQQNKQQQEILDEEAGTGEPAGAVDDWGFAIESKANNNKKGGGGIAAAHEPENDYADDNDFEDEESPMEKKKKAGKSSALGPLPRMK